jgi:hypothetical protein
MFRRKRRPASVDDQGDSPGPGLRVAALETNPQDIGLTPESGSVVWGVVLDTSFTDGGWYSLVVFADDTTSLYTSTAFGIIGAGAQPKVRAASDALLAAAENQLELFGEPRTTALPAPGMVTMRALTFGGPKAFTASEDALGNGRQPASELFHTAHDVISAVREAAEGR